MIQVRFTNQQEVIPPPFDFWLTIGVALGVTCQSISRFQVHPLTVPALWFLSAKRSNVNQAHIVSEEDHLSMAGKDENEVIIQQLLGYTAPHYVNP